MCACEQHLDPDAQCICLCPEHGNFQLAYDLAMDRYDEIRHLAAVLAGLYELAESWENVRRLDAPVPGLQEAARMLRNYLARPPIHAQQEDPA